VKPDWGAAMPGGGPEGLLKVAIESLNVPTHTIETSQLRSGETNMVQKRGYQTSTAETISIYENCPDCKGSLCVGILDFAQIVTLGELAKDSEPVGCHRRNDKVCMTEGDFRKSVAVVKT
jgi:hypothetical protein